MRVKCKNCGVDDGHCRRFLQTHLTCLPLFCSPPRKLASPAQAMLTSRVVFLLLLSPAAAVSDGAHTNSTCSSDLGCSLNGVCRSGACACDAPWGGPACALLQILPSPVAGAGAGAGIYGVAPNVTSWGGNVVQWPQDDGRFHLFVAEIAESCGMANWKNNSFVTHAVSDAVGGPYVEADVAVPSWAHNPQVIAHGTSLFLFHIGAGDGTAALTNCSAPRPAAGGPPAALRGSARPALRHQIPTQRKGRGRTARWPT